MILNITTEIDDVTVERWAKGMWLKERGTSCAQDWIPVKDIVPFDKEVMEGRTFEVATKNGFIYLSTFSSKFGGFSSDVFAFRELPDFPQELLDRLTNQTKQ